MNEQGLIYKCIAGSHAYGTNISTSDFDTRGCFIAPIDQILSCFNKVEQIEDKKSDTVIYEFTKFVKLCAENNPSILELLYQPEENIIDITQPFQELVDNRHLFLSKKCFHTFTGYGFAQLTRIKGHNKWINNPKPVDPPKIISYCKFINTKGEIIQDENYLSELSKSHFLSQTFGLTQFRVFKSESFFKEKLGFFTADGNNLKYVDVKQEILLDKAEFVGFFWVNLDEFNKNLTEWKNYWDWKNNRNEVRAKLEEKMHFDGKHALHLIRLLRMGKEILSTGQVIVKRPDKDFLLEIRDGKYSYDEILKMAEDLENDCKKLYETSTLQYSPNFEEIDKLYRNILIKYWKNDIF